MTIQYVNSELHKKKAAEAALVALPVQFSNLFLDDLRRLANLAA